MWGRGWRYKPVAAGKVRCRTVLGSTPRRVLAGSGQALLLEGVVSVSSPECLACRVFFLSGEISLKELNQITD